MTISVIIPTYKRLETLMQALQSLEEQSCAVFEILVVDNAVDTSVEHAITNFNQTARLRATYVPEPRLGVHYARNRAAQLAAGELLLFTDDDVTFDPHWVEAYAGAFAKHPEMAASGGPVRPYWEEIPPDWLLDFMGHPRDFGILSLMEPYESFQLGDKGYFWSCNMAIRKAILMERGGFHPEATGNIWLGDGEMGLNESMWAKGDLIGYVPDALVYHHIPAARMTPAYFRLRQANGGASDAFARYHSGIPGNARLWIDMLRIARRNLLNWLLAGLLRDRTGRFALNKQLAAARSRSHISYTLRLMRDHDFRAMVTKHNWMAE